MSGFEETNTPEQRRDLTTAIAHWQNALLLAPPEDIDSVSQEAIKELDSLWPYHKYLCSFAGPAVYSTIDSEGKATLHGQNGEKLEGEGYSEGFDVRSFEEGVRPKLYYRFYQGDVGSWIHPTLHHSFRQIAFVEPEAAVVPLLELDTALYDVATADQEAASSLDTFMNDMTQTSIALDGLYNSPDFRKLDLRKQQALIDRILEKCDHRYIALRGRRMVLQTKECIKPQLTENGIYQHQLSIEGMVLQGVFLGFNTLERSKLATRPIRRERDVAGRAAGLCMVLEIGEENAEAKLAAKDVVLVPAVGQKMNIGFPSIDS